MIAWTSRSSQAPIQAFRSWADERGWRFTPLYSSSQSAFNSDYNAEGAGGDQLPIGHVFTRGSGSIHHRWSSELFGAPHDPAIHPCHVDYMWPIWKLFDLTPHGRGTDWRPRYSYED